MKKRFILIGEPQSTNHLYKSTCRKGFPTVYMTRKGKDLKEDYGWQIKSQWRSGSIANGSVKVALDIFFKDKRAHDIDNYNKILLDAFSGIVWVDDKQIEELTIRKRISKENPRIEVLVVV